MDGLEGDPDSTLGVEKTCVDSDEVLGDLAIVTRASFQVQRPKCSAALLGHQ
jgi:hypothetical protein